MGTVTTILELVAFALLIAGLVLLAQLSLIVTLLAGGVLLLFISSRLAGGTRK